jgi:hypothetical protein
VLHGRFEFELSFDHQKNNRRHQGGGLRVIDPEKWAEKMDSQLREEERADSGRDQVFLAKRKLIDSQTPRLWKQLTHSLGELARAFNKRRNILAIEDEGNSFRVRRSDSRGAALVSADFLAAENRISILLQPGDWFRNYAAKVIPGDGEGTVCLCLVVDGDDKGTQHSTDEIATAAMEALLSSQP